VTRSDFQRLAEVRIAEARVLSAAGKWDGAYYLAGYAVECALKGCIAKRTKAEEFPPKKKIVEDYYSHDLNVLLKGAELEDERKVEAKANPQFQTLWAEVVKWNEQARYETKTQVEAESLYNAITDPTNGVLRWVRGHW
jgi:HEPN domain-containing protein